jgi:hypothetical protein
MFFTTFSPLVLLAQTALIIGDSHMVGDFGEYLHRQIQALNRYDVISIGVGGAGSYHFTQPLKNFCCGYRVRESCIGEKLDKNKKVRVLEEGWGSDQKPILVGFGGRLSAFAEAYQPDLVVVALGSNYTNAHSQLLQILRKASPKARIVWVAPFRRADFEKRLALIESAVKRDPLATLIRTDDLLGHDTIQTAHFSGGSARRWASLVAERMKVIL